MPIDLIVADPELQNIYVDLKMQNESTWSLVRVVVKQLELLRGNRPVAAFKLPAAVVLRPVCHDEQRLRLPTGEVYLRTSGLAPVLVLPPRILDCASVVARHTRGRQILRKCEGLECSDGHGLLVLSGTLAALRMLSLVPYALALLLQDFCGRSAGAPGV